MFRTRERRNEVEGDERRTRGRSHASGAIVAACAPSCCAAPRAVPHDLGQAGRAAPLADCRPMRESPALVESRRFGTRTVPVLRPLGWLVAGWRDFMRRPLPGLLHGLLLAAFGAVLFWAARNQFWLL